MPGITEDPGSWNLYSYVQGDPINYADPEGLTKCGDIPIIGGVFKGQTLSQAMSGKSDASLLAQLIYHEGGAITNAHLNNYVGYWEDLAGIGTAVLNQRDADNAILKVYQRGRAVCPLGQSLNRSIFQILTTTALASDNRGQLFDVSGNMRQPERSQIDNILNGDMYAGVPLVNNGNLIGSYCQGIMSSIGAASQLIGGEIDRLAPDGNIILFWNKASPDDAKYFPGNKGYTGYKDGRAGGHTFWGLPSVSPPPRLRPMPPRGGRPM